MSSAVGGMKPMRVSAEAPQPRSGHRAAMPRMGRPTSAGRSARSPTTTPRTVRSMEKDEPETWHDLTESPRHVLGHAHDGLVSRAVKHCRAQEAKRRHAGQQSCSPIASHILTASLPLAAEHRANLRSAFVLMVRQLLQLPVRRHRVLCAPERQDDRGILLRRADRRGSDSRPGPPRRSWPAPLCSRRPPAATARPGPSAGAAARGHP